MGRDTRGHLILPGERTGRRSGHGPTAPTGPTGPTGLGWLSPS